MIPVAVLGIIMTSLSWIYNFNYNFFDNLISFSLLFLCFYCLYISLYIIELSDDYFTVTKKFFNKSEKKYYLKNIKNIKIRTNYNNNIVNITIYFSNNKNIQIHQFQRNFKNAIYVINTRFKDQIEYKHNLFKYK